MAKRARSWNKTKYERYVKEGRGQGEGSTYMPWISVHDFSSRGMVSRIVGHKTKRVHHFLSRSELNYFFLLEWSDKILDIREQFPLIDMELAVGIAQKIGIKYPTDNVSGFPYVLTCDFMITTVSGLKARTIKHAAELQSKRVIEKLEIERRYWQSMGIEWKIVTENEIPRQKCLNIEWLYSSAGIPEPLADCQIRKSLLRKIRDGVPACIAIGNIDNEWGLPSGSGLLLLKNMLWHKELAFDMDNPLPAALWDKEGTGKIWLP
ncbi:MAG TPA: heteromeric transposase endonuclease subunit TnsA [Lachnospiraceae bacterium]|nr:heteromeric transposase endonuclease subunit TnsA [Lachnospiraceae bacterium]